MIRPCPFCGVTPAMKESGGDYGYTPPSVSLGCGPCGVFIMEDTQKWEQGIGHFSVRKTAIAKLLQRWNGRVQ
jgi:hypothetical protein